MKKTHKKGFIGMLVLIAIAVGAMYFVKDEKGVSYGKKGYDLIHYYMVDRGAEAMEKAESAKDIIQSHQNEIDNMLK